MSEKPKRRRTRFHLATAVVLMIAAAIAVGLDVEFFRNASERMEQRQQILGYEWPLVVVIQAVVLIALAFVSESIIRRRSGNR